MKSSAAVRFAVLALGLGVALSAWAGGGHHWHDLGIGAAGEHGHVPAGPAPVTAPHGGGHTAPPAVAPGVQLAGAGHHHGDDHGRWGDHGDRDGDHDWHHDWGHGDIHFFPVYDWYAWHGGYWHHGWYGPRFGWWWVVSGVWFFYPVPVYPYPDPYLPSDFAAPPPPAGTPAPVAGQFFYFCPAANAYYPYVPSCPTGWQQVPADSDPAPQPPNPPPPGG